MNPSFVVFDQGDAILTPSYDQLTMTLTVRIGPYYAKIRNIDAGIRSVVTARFSTGFHEKDWFSVGDGDKAVLLRKAHVYREMVRIIDPERKEKIVLRVYSLFELMGGRESSEKPEADELARNTYISSIRPSRDSLHQDKALQVTALGDASVGRRERAYKISALMTRTNHLAVIRKKVFYEGGTKIHSKAVFLHITSLDDAVYLSKKYVISKGRDLYGISELCKSFSFSEILTGSGCSGCSAFQMLDRGGFFLTKQGLLRKFELLSEYCAKKRDLKKFICGHFTQEGVVAPQYKHEHLLVAYQIACVLAKIHERKLVHSDIKLENILVFQSPGGPDVRIIDFDLTEKIGAIFDWFPGTYPSPEAVAKIEEMQAPKPSSREPSEPRVVGDKTETHLAGGILTPAIDQWAFGLLLYQLLYATSAMDEKFGYGVPASTMLEEVSKLHDKLAPLGTNALDDVIRRLLSVTYFERPSMQAVSVMLAGMLDTQTR